MPTINLAPGTQYLRIVRRRRRGLFLLSALLGLIVVATWLVLALVTRSTDSELQRAESQLRAVETQIAQLKDDEDRIKAFEARLLALDSLLKHHVSWTPLFKEIERLLPASVVLTSIKADFEQGSVALFGSAPDVDQVAQTLASVSAGPDHATLFHTALLKSVRRQASGSEGQPSGLAYDFDAVLSFTKSALQTNTGGRAPASL